MSQTLRARALTFYGLKPRQYALLLAYCESGDMEEACRRTGYLKERALEEIANSPGFQAAVREQLAALAVRDAVKARVVLSRLMDEAKNERVRLDAARILTERALGRPGEAAPPDSIQNMSRDQILFEIRKLAEELGYANRDQVRPPDTINRPAPYVPAIPPTLKRERATIDAETGDIIHGEAAGS